MSKIIDARIIGLTGGIACGKSTVARLLEQHGFPVIDADRLGHRVLKQGHPGFKEVVQAFGEDILDGRGHISRPKLGTLVFQDPDKLEKLNRISHPHISSIIGKEARKLSQDQPGGVVFIEAALLIETGWHKQCWKIWIVTAEKETVLRRLAERNGLSREEAMLRIEVQMSQEDQLALADVILPNEGSPRDLELALEKVLKVLRVNE